LNFYPTLADQNQPDGGPKELNETCFSCEIITVLKIKNSKTKKIELLKGVFFFLIIILLLAIYWAFANIYRMYFGVIY